MSLGRGACLSAYGLYNFIYCRRRKRGAISVCARGGVDGPSVGHSSGVLFCFLRDVVIGIFLGSHGHAEHVC